MEPGSGEYHKLKNWIDIFMQIPFNKVSKLPVSIETSTDKEISKFLVQRCPNLKKIRFRYIRYVSTTNVYIFCDFFFLCECEIRVKEHYILQNLKFQGYDNC